VLAIIVPDCGACISIVFPCPVDLLVRYWFIVKKEQIVERKEVAARYAKRVKRTKDFYSSIGKGEMIMSHDQHVYMFVSAKHWYTSRRVL